MSSNDDFQNICANIRYLRSSHGLSRTVMARKLGITIKSLDLLESGIMPRRCTVRLLYNIQKNFAVSPYDCLAIRLEDIQKP